MKQVSQTASIARGVCIFACFHRTMPLKEQKVKRRTLLLIGGGHAHIQVILDPRLAALPDVRCVLLSDSPTAIYSGLLPAVVAGLVEEPSAGVDLRALCRANGFVFVHGRATGIDPQTKRVLFQPAHAYNDTNDNDGSDNKNDNNTSPDMEHNNDELGINYTLRYSVLSINVGSVTRQIPCGVPAPKEWAMIYTRPIGRLVPSLRAFEARQRAGKVAGGKDGVPRVLVVGAGAAGLELALALEARLHARVTMVTSETSFGREAGRAAATAVASELQNRGIRSVTGRRVTLLRGLSTSDNGEGANEAELDDGKDVERFDVAIIATGAAPRGFLSATQLPRNNEGWLIVRPCLRAVGHDDIFAVGDCASFDDRSGLHAPSKAGVFAVRQGPVLAHNLHLALTHLDSSVQPSWRQYKPQSDFLTLISTGDGRAIGSKYGVAFKGTWVFRLKMHIDESWQKKFRINQKDVNERASQQAQKKMSARSRDDQSGDDKEEDDGSLEFDGSPEEAAAALVGGEDIFTDDSFDRQFAILMRMDHDDEFRKAVARQVCADSK